VALVCVYDLVLTDKESGYTYSCKMDKDGKQKVNVYIQSAFDFYERYGHHFNAWGKPIVEIRTDSDSIFMYEKAFKKNRVQCQNSAEYQHEQNGLAESVNQDIANIVTCFYAKAISYGKSKVRKRKFRFSDF
jgi:hypothetical protein